MARNQVDLITLSACAEDAHELAMRCRDLPCTERTPCLIQAKARLELRDPNSLCRYCRAYWYTARAAQTLARLTEREEHARVAARASTAVGATFADLGPTLADGDPPDNNPTLPKVRQ